MPRDNKTNLLVGQIAQVTLRVGVARTAADAARVVADEAITTADAALPATDYNAADILLKLLTVDGPGSGLDADTLDGHDASYFATSAGAYTDEMAQDAIGAMIDTSLVYADATPLLTRAALTGDATAAQGSNALTLATVNLNVGSFGGAGKTITATVNGKGLVTAFAEQAIAITASQVTDFTEAAQDAVGAMVDTSLVYVDATPLLTRAALAGDVTAAQGSNATTVVKINGVSMAGLATGILKNTTGTGAPSIAVAGDFPTLNQNTTGSAATLTTSRNFSISGGGITAAAVGFNGSGAVVLSASVDAGHITLARMANMATASLIYRKTAGAGAPEVQTLATLKTDLGLTGTNSGDQTSIVGITGTKAQFNTANSDGDFVFTSDLGANVATFLATPSSANLRSALTDETGAGAAVFADSPTFTGTALFAALTASGLLTSTVAAGQPVIYANQATGSIAVDGTYDFATQQFGFFFIGETAIFGQMALCATDGTNVKIIWQSSTGYTSTLDNAGTVNLYYNAGKPRLQNKLGGAANFNIFSVKVS